MKKSKSLSNNKDNNLKIITFWFFIGIVTIAFIIMLIFNLPTRRIKSLSQITHLKMNELFTQKEEIYYVYVYDSSNLIEEGKNHNLKPVILDYANFVRANKLDDYKIYCFDINYPSHEGVKSFEHAPYGIDNFEHFTVDAHDLPILITIEGGSIQDRKTKELDIEKELGNRKAEIIDKAKVKAESEEIYLSNWVAILDKKDFLL